MSAKKTDAHSWWAVVNKDGSQLEEYPSDGSYTPYRKIDWPNVETLILESDFARTEIPIGVPPQGYKLSLRSRHTKLISHGVAAMAYILLSSKEDEEVATSTIHALYWLPDGSTHTCDQFNCSLIKEYVTDLANKRDVTLAATHG